MAARCIIGRGCLTPPGGREAAAGPHPVGTFKASDGWINLTILRDPEFPVLCDALDLPDAKADPRFATNDLRFANRVALNAALEPAFAGRTTGSCRRACGPRVSCTSG